MCCAVQLAGDRERADRANLEHQLKERTQELEELKARTDGAVTDLNRRYAGEPNRFWPSRCPAPPCSRIAFLCRTDADADVVDVDVYDMT